MSAKLLSALLVSAALVAPGVALAAPPADRCADFGPPFDFGSPGDYNKAVNDVIGNPGQQTTFNIPPNEFADLRNDARKTVCPPPGHQ